MKRRNLAIYIGAGVMVLTIAITAVLVTKTKKDEYARLEKSNLKRQELVAEGTDNSQKQTANNDSKQIPEQTKDGMGLESPADDDNKKEEVTQSESENQQDIVGQEEDAKAEAVSVTQYNFHSSSSLDWPVKGNVIINYSMEHMIYFATLDQYRYSPAIAIEAEEGTDVKAAAAGQVLKVETTPDTGLTVTMMIGPEYEIVYGQLKDCDLKPGDHVKRGELIGKVAKVTGYYEMEGDHLYLMLTRDGNYENPLSYLAFSE